MMSMRSTSIKQIPPTAPPTGGPIPGAPVGPVSGGEVDEDVGAAREHVAHTLKSSNYIHCTLQLDRCSIIMGRA